MQALITLIGYLQSVDTVKKCTVYSYGYGYISWLFSHSRFIKEKKSHFFLSVIGGALKTGAALATNAVHCISLGNPPKISKMGNKYPTWGMGPAHQNAFLWDAFCFIEQFLN